MTGRFRCILWLALLGQPLLAGAQESRSGVVTIEGARIVGDQEVPTVLYLVPWQPPAAPELAAPNPQPLAGAGDRPLDRYEFQRLVRYQAELAGEGTHAGAAPEQ